ncbi:MAG: outer membrane lipoprotein-sorting protein [Candidatus Tectomicrobia bacterium]|uniref:Outer membrane lipoprotein-sorting protein n=1 Tax=Tectimicrobiota bacterium TaxID=2528274 RepID=A0A932CP60_UNCTE|nr:outer membrane lipoprotein-sorting protein [Candidatus Tectomicrobia bacterium]
MRKDFTLMAWPLLLSLAGLLLLSGERPGPLAAAEPSRDLTARQIMALVKQAQENWEDEVAELAFLILDKDQDSTLRWATRKRKSCRGREGIDKKTVLLLKYPPKYRGFAYLSWSYLDPAAHDRKWLYYADDLDTVRGRKGRRVRPLGYDRGDSFLRILFEGNDFTYEDLSERPVEADTHRIVGQEPYNYRDCYRIESFPRDGDHAYQKRVSWIWKEAWLPLKIDFYDREGRPFKVRHNHWTKVQGIWTLRQSVMKDLRREEMTILVTQAAVYNTGLKDYLFAPIALEQAR